MSDSKNAAATPAAPKEETVAVYNRGGGAFIHGEYRLEPGQFLEVPKHIAELWLGHGGAHGRVVLAADRGMSAQAPDAKLVQENADLKKAEADSAARIRVLEEQLAAAQAAAGGGAPVPVVPPKPKTEKSKPS